MRNTSSSILSLLALLAAAGCAAEVPVETDEVDAADEGKADSTGELRVRAGETTVWMDHLLVPRTQDGRDEWVLSGRASRNVEGAFSFIFDDVVGDALVVSARGFDVAYPAGDRGLMTGVPHFVRLTFAPSASRPDTLTARVIARPRLVDWSGAGTYLTAELAPVVVGGRVVFRVSGKTSSAIDDVSASVGDLVLGSGDVRVVDSTRFTVDLLDDHVTALAAGAELVLDLELASGTWQKRARLAIAVKRLGLTSGDPADVWPPATCEEEVRDCLGDLPDGASDTSACGEALAVLACGGQGGVVFDDGAFAAAAARADDTIQSGTLAADSSALVGSDKDDELTFAVLQEMESGFEQMTGQRFGSQAALDEAVGAVITGAIDHAYARPLDFVEAHTPSPGSLSRTRQVVADALLARLADMDLTQTEFGRPLEELTRLFRTRHVADLLAFRTSVTPVVDGQGNDVYIHNWLDPHVEITVSPATGAVTNILFEID